MFGGSLFGDPFFGDMGSQMRDMQSMHEQMMQGLMGFRAGPTQPAIDYQQGGGGRQVQVARRRDPLGFPGGGMFGGGMLGGGMLGGGMFGGGMFGGGMLDMNAMMGNMAGMASTQQGDPNAQFYSSSSVMSFSNTGNGAPKVYQASSSTRQGPGGVREERKMERNSSTGIEKVHHGRHIGQRGHVVQRQQNLQSGDREENVEYVNLDEEEGPQFDQEWRSSAGRPNQHAVADARSRRTDKAADRYVPTPMERVAGVTARKARMEKRKPHKKVTINSAVKSE